MKLKVKKYGCFWIVLWPHPAYGQSYNHVHNTFYGALRCALLGRNLPCSFMH